MLQVFRKLTPKFISFDDMSFCVHQSMKYVVSAKSVMSNHMTTNQEQGKNDIPSVKYVLLFGILYVDLETTVNEYLPWILHKSIGQLM